METALGPTDEAAHCRFDPFKILSFDIHVYGSENKMFWGNIGLSVE